MIKTKWLAGLCAVLLAGVADADAQMLQWQDQGYAALNLGVQPQSRTFTELSTPVIYGENAEISVDHSINSGLFFDISGGVRVWRNLAVGLGFSRFGDSESSTVGARIPSPIFFNSPRSASAGTGEMDHSETAVHLQFLWMLPISDKIELAAILGPSFYSIKQDFVGDITIQEDSGSFGAASITGVQLESVSEGATGFTAGLDGTYLLTERYGARLGVGGYLRYSGASADLTTPSGTTVSVDAGGLQLGAGLRVRF